MGRPSLPRESRLKSRVVPKLGSGSTPVPLKPKFGTLRGVNGRILKLVVLGSASCSFKQKFGEVDLTVSAGPKINARASRNFLRWPALEPPTTTTAGANRGGALLFLSVH